MSSLSQREEFDTLLSAFCSGELAERERARLKELLHGDDGLRRRYVHYVQMHLQLSRALGGLPARKPVALPVRRESAAATPHPPPFPVPARLSSAPRDDWRRAGVLAGSMLAALVALALLLRFGAPYEAGPVATLTQARDCEWETPLAAGAELMRGRLVLTAGVAQLTFRGGAVMLVEAPAEIEPLDARRAYLHSGRVVVRAAAQGKDSFVVDSARASVLDEGTEFGVGVSRSGETLVQVFEGSVMADFQPSLKKPQRLVAGEAFALEGNEGGALRRISFDTQRFIRRLPDPPPVKWLPDHWLVPYNTNRSTVMTGLRAPGAVTVDGELSDWNRSAPFASRCGEPYGEHYRFTGYLMYDAEYIYVGGHVKDPSPMCSVIDPATDPNVGWKGGSVQFRISTDRKLGWPANGELWRPRNKPRPAEDTNPKFSHLTFWYHQPTKSACLYIEHGMDFHVERINPAGYRGAFRKDADGLGYSFEYAIPLALLNAQDDPPRAGDRLAACWNVHWSDAGGRLWKGMLVDLLNPAEKGTTYSRGATWGQLILK